MTRGVYTAASGMMAEEAAQQIVAQNLANASTTGYKQDVPVFKSFEENLVSFANESGDMTSTLGNIGNGAEFSKSVTDLSQGPLQATGNALDIAMTGNAFLAIKTPSGTRYTRDGALTLNASGTLVQAGTGNVVLSDRGTPIQLPLNATDIRIDPNGTVKTGTAEIAKLGLYAISSEDRPQKIGENLLTVGVAPRLIDATRDPDAGVRSGYIEASNVNIVKQMVTMIAGLRAYEANQKALQSEDDVEQKSVNDVARVQ